MSMRELYDWYEYYNDEPFFSDRIEMQLATICVMVAGASGVKKPKHSDYMIRKPQKVVKSEKQKQKELIAAFKSL